MKNPESPSRPGVRPSFLEELAQAHLARTVARALAVLFGAWALFLAVLFAAAPSGPARFYVPEARAGEAASPPTTSGGTP